MGYMQQLGLSLMGIRLICLFFCPTVEGGMGVVNGARLGRVIRGRRMSRGGGGG